MKYSSIELSDLQLHAKHGVSEAFGVFFFFLYIAYIRDVRNGYFH